MKICIGSNTFPTYISAKNYVEKFKREHSSLNTNDKKIFMEMFLNYYPDKWRLDNVKDIDIEKHPTYGDKCFYIIKIDGEKEFISSASCFKSIPSNISFVKKAFRNVIYEQIQEFKDFNDCSNCYLCGLNICNNNLKLNIDHAYPYDSIITDWSEKYGYDLENIKCDKTADGIYYPVNDELVVSFTEYHYERAELKPSCHKCNAMKSNKIY
jgi:hypothetical protein